MNILKTAALGMAGFLVYRAWQQRKANPASSSAVDLRDAGGTTPPHGDALLGDADQELALPRMAQSSRGFGEP